MPNSSKTWGLPSAFSIQIEYSVFDRQAAPRRFTMAFNEALASRIRHVLVRRRNVEEKKMFGCICFFINGNALAGVWKDRLIARLGPDEGEAALREPHVKKFDITGRPMRNWVAVEPGGVWAGAPRPNARTKAIEISAEGERRAGSQV